MKNYIFLLLFFAFFISCNKKDKLEEKIKEIPLNLKIERFDKIFFESTPNQLPAIKKQYSFFFPKNTSDIVFLEKIKNPLWRQLFEEVQKKYPNNDSLKVDLEYLFKHIKEYYPNAKVPRVVTLISEMDYNFKAIYTDTLVVIPLELYLGKKHKFYEFANYIKENCEPNQILPDIVSSFAISKIPPYKEKTFLAAMIQEGKKMYLKDILLPKLSDEVKIGYTKAHLKWCEDNESDIWRYFVENSLLYSSDAKLISRFINPAPFSKFYLEIDNESPGRVGQWVGWQIVKACVENENLSLEQLMRMNAKEIFVKSKYKPNRNG